MIEFFGSIKICFKSSVVNPSSGAMIGKRPTISGISGAYNDLVAVIYGLTNATASTKWLNFSNPISLIRSVIGIVPD